jgi:ribosomal protein S18 acetylase RimI-like enzyme
MLCYAFSMQIEIVADVTPDLVSAMARLLPQLSPNVRTPSHADLAKVVGSSGTSLLIARDEEDRFVGTLTLFVTATPSKVFGFIEDVVVDESARGHGVGEALVTEALRIAADRGATQTELHSGNHRQPAIRLYERVGFKRFDTNVFRYRHAPRG